MASLQKKERVQGDKISPENAKWNFLKHPVESSQADRVIQPGTFTGTGGQAGDSLLGGHNMILYMYLKEPTCTADVC